VTDFKKNIKRNDGRTPDQLRPVSFSRGIYEYAAGSVLFEMGKTKVLCAVSIQQGVPQFLRGKNAGGWLTAEYALLPTSTTVRTQREASQGRKDGRAVEIARFIGRCFRSVVDVSEIGERTITIDCDVLQADGGTRTAAITGSFMALMMAQEKWLQSRVINKPIIVENIAAISVGVVHDSVLLDLSCNEDNIATADFNFVITQSNKIIEMQGGAESCPLSWDMFEKVRVMACSGVEQLFSLCSQDDQSHGRDVSRQQISRSEEKTPLFSLKNRLQI
jgi:ribonuclease PH